MKYTFFGTPRFAEIVLKKLIEAEIKPQVVVCNPDRPVDRSQEVSPPPTKVVAAEHNILVWQPEKLNSSQFEVLSSHNLFIVAAYGKIIPKEIIEIPKKGSLVVHPSILPKYRGATPIRSAILAGEKKTGTTIIEMDEKMDHGPVLAEKEIEIGDMNYLELRDKLAEISAELLIEIIPQYLEGKAEVKPQNHDEATFTKKFKSEDAYISPEKLKKAIEEGGGEAEEISRMIRALNPEPGVWTELKEPYQDLPKEKRIKLLGFEINNKKLVLTEIHVAGKNPRKVEITAL
jgi:methionyl-tRNA formyltransferase